jgi:para-nitrobenzyl esterase
MDTVIVQTSAGALRGRWEGDVAVFKGIPFAAPPTGRRRFRPPELVESWTGVRDAFEFAPTPPQMQMPLVGALPPQGEDCLGVNVWTPAVDDSRRPVLVWIHGGGFMLMSAADPTWAGANLAARGDVVVVSVSYRLGALGFTHLADAFGDDYATSGNCGLLDQVAALRWVRENIAAFGGDPANVTIFGESAGGMSVGCLLGMPAAAGLFHKAIPQSGAAETVMPPELGAASAARFLDAAGIAPGDVDSLAALPVEKVLEAQAATMAAYGELRKQVRQAGLAVSPISLPFSPVQDGVTFPDQPLAAVAAGLSKEVPMLIGTTRHEWRLFTELLRLPVATDEASLLRRLTTLLSGTGTDPEKAAALYRANRPGEPSRRGSVTPSAGNVDVSLRLAVDRVRWPSRCLPWHRAALCVWYDWRWFWRTVSW